MTGPDDLRIGDAERDSVTTALHDHFAAGRLDRGELDERLDTALAAKTRGDLQTIMSDLPAPHGLPERVPEHRGRRHALVHAQAHAAHHPLHHGHHHGHHHRFPAFPLLAGLFAFMVIAAGPGAAILAVLQVAMLIWVVRAVALGVRTRRSRPR